jgi:hypothetical protein
MSRDSRSVDWRMPAIWTLLLSVSAGAGSFIEVADSGHRLSLASALVDQTSSHIVIAALLPALYWLHRLKPISRDPRNILFHVLAVVPFSFLHTVGMAGLRLLWFAGFRGEPYAFPLTMDRFLYEFTKDIVSYATLSAGLVAVRYLLERTTPSVPVVEKTAMPEAPVRPERFAVRKRGGSEVVVEVADIDWIEASGNYAILHVGGETFEIRSSLTRLEGELDPRRFVRVHKSHLVNIGRVAEVTPWVSGDWRLRLQDGAEVNLSRRYRERFEALAPVRS